MLLQEFDEVGVLGHDDDVCTAGGCEDFRVRRSLKVQSRTGRHSTESAERIHAASAGGS